MNVWLTPNLQPFVGGTYFPPEDGLTRVGFRTVLLRIRDQVSVHREGGTQVQGRERGASSSRGPLGVAPTSHSGNRARTPY